MSGTFLLSAEAAFAAAHTLPGVDMCARMHGHNWRVRVTARVEADRIDMLYRPQVFLVRSPHGGLGAIPIDVHVFSLFAVVAGHSYHGLL